MRRIILASIFLLIVLSVVAGLHVYLAQRLVLETGLAPGARTLGVALLCVLGASLVLAPIAERTLPRRAARWLAWPAALWMGFAFLLSTLLGASDLLLWLAGSAASAAAANPSLAAGDGSLRALAILGLGTAIGGVALRAGLRFPGVRRVELPLARWPRALDGFRIVQISDVHIGPILGRDFACRLVERVNALDADLIGVTGDLVDGSVECLANEVEPFGHLRARCGVFFVTGNHDHYSGGDDWAAHAAQLGMRPLRNERVSIGDAQAGFDLAGVDDHHGHLVSGSGGEDLPGALDGRDPERPVVLLAHDPNTFRAAARLGVDLQISGHTHGGQIWPFGYLVRLAIPFLAGVYERGTAKLYVSRGTGFWGPPMRLFAPAEITELVLRGDV